MQNIDYFYYLLLSIIASSMIIILYILRQNKGINIGRPRKLKKKNQVERATDYLGKMDVDFQSRINYLLVAESMLMVSFVTALSIKEFSLICTAIALVGTGITLLWLLSNIRLIMQIQKLQIDYLLPNDPVYWDSIRCVRRGPYAAFFLTYALPNLILLLWIFLLFDSCFQINILVLPFVFGLLFLFNLFIFYYFRLK